MNSANSSNSERRMDDWLNGTVRADDAAPPCQGTEAELDAFVQLALVEGLLLSSQISPTEQANRLRAMIQPQSWRRVSRPQLIAAAALLMLSLTVWKFWPQAERPQVAKPVTPVQPSVARPTAELKSVIDHSLAIEEKPYHRSLSAFVYPELTVTELTLGEALQVLLTATELPADIGIPEFYIAPDLHPSELRKVTLRLNCVSFQSLVQTIALQAGCRVQRSGKGFYLYQDPALADSSKMGRMDISAKEAEYLIDRQNFARNPQEELTDTLANALKAAFDEPVTVSWVSEPRYRIEGSPRFIAVMEEIRQDLAFQDSHYEIQVGPFWVIPNSPLHKKMRAQQAVGIAVLGIFPTDEVKQNLTGASQTLTNAPISGPQGTWLSCGGISWERHALRNEIIRFQNDVSALRKNAQTMAPEELSQRIAKNEQEQAAKQARIDALNYAVKISPQPNGRLRVAVRVLDAIEYHDLPANSTLVFTLDASDKPLAGTVTIRPLGAGKR